jgi:transposase
MELHTIGIDLGKTVFHLVGLNQRGEVVVRKKFARKNNCCTSLRTCRSS